MAAERPAGADNQLASIATPEPAPRTTAKAGSETRTDVGPHGSAAVRSEPLVVARAGSPRRRPGMAGASSAMALGTLASRFTGFIRTAVLLYAIGTHDLGNAYNVANNLPNAVYNLALGGILTSVVVPLLVKAQHNRDGGEAYDQRIFTLSVFALGVITVAATAAAVPITAIYGHGMGNAATYHLTVIFTYFFLPQIFFYGVSSLAGAILNARGSFAAPMWTPVINNVVVSLVGIGLILTAGTNRTPENISSGETQLLAIGTTLGIVLQTAALWPSMRRVGFRWRPRFDFRRAEVAEIGRMGGWMFFYIIATQLSLLATTIVSNAAGARVCATCAGAGYAAFSNAWQLFQLPFAIVGVSVITAMLPRMSEHAAVGRFELLTRDFSTAARLSSVIIVPAAMILAVLGPPLAQAVFGHGSTSEASARYLGVIFGVFCLGLLPYTLFNLLLRVFYAMHDSRTPALIGGVSMAVRIAASFLALAILPPADVVAGLGVGFGLSSLIMAVWLWRVLSRRVGGLDTGRVTRTLVRMHVAAIPGTIFAVLTSIVVGVLAPPRTITALAVVAIGGSGGLLLYLMTARILKVTEVGDVARMLWARLILTCRVRRRSAAAAASAGETRQ
jgi:putative peptidoglycan lipid II flippase